MKKLMSIILLALFLNSCKTSDNSIIKYTIKKGANKSVFTMDLCSDVLKYDVLFNESAKYDLNSVDQYDINKLFGFNSCNSIQHHTNSARFGWRWLNDSLEIHAYIYENEVRYFQKICSVQLNTWNSYSLEDNYFAYIFILNDNTYIFTKSQNCISNYHYALYPYFGGNQEAPHDITIYFKER